MPTRWLDFVEMETALIRVAAVVNRRPLSVRLHNEDAFASISPADLLLGRIIGYEVKGEKLDETGEMEDLTVRVDLVGEFVRQWWKQWLSSALVLLSPRKK